MTRFLLTIVTMTLASAIPVAWTAGASPQDVVIDTSNRMIERLKAEKTVIENEPSKIYELVDEILLPQFDFVRMSKLVLGKNWRRATVDQRKRFTSEFRELLVRTYATSLAEYTDQEIVFLPFRGSASDNNATVHSEVTRPGDIPVEISYRLHNQNNAWKVFDVTIENVSLVTNYRSSYAQEIKKSGLDGLITKLAERNAKARNNLASG